MPSRHAQFSVVPSRSFVEALFVKLTGRPMVPEVCWTTWYDVSSEEYYALSPYIRPCHQKILSETIEGIQKTPCALLRQFLRPYNFRIESTYHGYVLKEKTEKPSTPVLIPGKKRIIWSEDATE